MTPEQHAVLVRIDERTESIKETLVRHETAIADQATAIGDLEKFRSRTRGTTKGVTAGIGLVTLIATAVAKAKGMF